MDRNKMKNSLLLVTLLVMLSGGITPAGAVSSNFSFGPTNPDKDIPEIIHLELRPGDTFTGSVTATNNEDIPGTFSLYPTDTEYNQSLHMVYKAKGGTRTLASSWITMDENEFTLGPKEKKTFEFTMNIPKDAGISNLYRAGIVLEKIIGSDEKTLIKSRAQLVIPVELNVTMNPKHIEKYGETNLLSRINGPGTWVSVALFLAGMGYFIHETRKEKLAKAKQNSQPDDDTDKNKP